MTTSSPLTESYFHKVSQALSDAGAHRPTLVVDKKHLDHNLESLMRIINQGFDYRIVAKSLPSVPMLEYIMRRSGSQRLMSFHLPFLLHVAEHLPTAEILLGKPMPVESVRQFYQWHKQQQNSLFKPQQQLQWLVDSNARLQQYRALAEELNIVLNINLEIDIGLHRGGFANADEFSQALKTLKSSDYIQLSGLMGYEAHISKIPALLGGHKKAFKDAMATYQGYVNQVVAEFGEQILADLTLNTGGSSTYPLYDNPESMKGLVNEIATASALVKPTDFDVFTLDHHIPAAFIATPVLKIVHDPEFPGAKGLSKLLHKVGLLPRKACFIYGGNWLAKPCYPFEAKRSNILGHSSNQEMYELHKDNPIAMDDFMFFRPTQSEAVFLQFGEIAIYDDGKIIDWWPVFEQERPSSEKITIKKSPEISPR